MMSCNITGSRGRSETERDCRFCRGLPVWDLSLSLLAEAVGHSGQCSNSVREWFISTSV